MKALITQALGELERFPLPWQAMVRKQLEYCFAVVLGEASPEKLEQLNIGLIAVREIDEEDPLHSLLIGIQYELQRKFLPYAAKVRLNIR
ncbi:immunity protein Tsi6 family protein [Oceanospirillum sp. HFRX-1_2]